MLVQQRPIRAHYIIGGAKAKPGLGGDSRLSVVGFGGLMLASPAEAVDGIKELGQEKCRVAEWPEGCKDANDVLLSHGPEIVRECLLLARPFPVAGIEKVEDRRPEMYDFAS